MTLVSWQRPNCHVTECHMTLQASHDTSVTVTFEVSHDAPPEPVMKAYAASTTPGWIRSGCPFHQPQSNAA